MKLWNDGPDPGGTELFSETHPTVPLDDGVFSIHIGSDTGGGVPDSALAAPEL